MSLIKEHRLPRSRQVPAIRRRAEPGGGRVEFLGGRQRPLEFPHPLLQLDAVAVHALKDRIELACNDGLVGALRHQRFEISGHAESQQEGRASVAVKLMDHHGQFVLRLDHVGACQGDTIGPPGIMAERLPHLTGVAVKVESVLGRRVKQPVAQWQPEGGNPGAINALPEEFRRDVVSAAHAALKPVGLVARELQQLRHLGMMPERVERPADAHVHTQFVPVVALPVQGLPYPRLAARNVDVQHDVVAAHDLESPLGDELPKRFRFSRIPFEKRLHVGCLVKHKPIIRILLEEMERLQDVG